MPTAFNRRDLIVGAAGLLASAPLESALAAAMPDVAGTEAAALKDVAARRRFRFGTALSYGALTRDPAYAALVARQCDLLVAENEMKWQWLRPTPTTFAFDRFDAILGWGEAHGMAVRGHNLLWHQPKWLPAWLNAYDFGSAPHREAERLLTTHIDTVTRRYGTRIKSYDVVNEAVNPKDGTLYETSLSKALGGTEPTLDLAFHTARAAAPHAQLVYNDYMSWEPGNDAHRAGVLRLLEGFRRRGTPVDALGVQSHLITQGLPTASHVAALEGPWRQFLDAVTHMGYALVVTELDVRDNNLPADIAVRDRGVADFTRAYLDVTLAYPQLTDVLCWGLADRHSWIEGFEPRRDRAPRRPTLYDTALQPKPMRAAVAAALAAAPIRTG